jgi:hypothetical protein
MHLRVARFKETREQEKCLVRISGVREISEKIMITAGHDKRVHGAAFKQPPGEIEIRETGTG